MAKTLAEIIADAAADDNLEFATADGTKFKLADIRGFRSSVETERQEADAVPQGSGKDRARSERPSSRRCKRLRPK